MRKKMSKKMLSVVIAAGMAMSLAACGETTDPATPDGGDTTTGGTTTEGGETAGNTTGDNEGEVEKYTAKKDADGNVYDLGGMEIIVSDWWSDAEGVKPEARNDYEEARDEWLDWIQETYNFTIKQCGTTGWAEVVTDFIAYATDPSNKTDNGTSYAFIVREDKALTGAINEGLCYDLSTLDCIDFSRVKFTSNRLHEQFSIGGGIYAMYGGRAEARTGVYFNKQVLRDAGIDPESIYDMQADGTWTWDVFADMCDKIQRDTDNDGVENYYGICCNNGVMVNMSVFSNNSDFIGYDGTNFTYDLENEGTVEALQWCTDMFTKYNNHDPEGAAWNYYMDEFKSGTIGFFIDDAYNASAGNWLAADDVDLDLGFVFFPKGPKATKYVNAWSNNPVVLPACYDEERAWKVAFAWDLYTDVPAGYEEDYSDTSNYLDGKFDLRSVNETIIPMSTNEHGIITFHGIIPNLDLGPDLTWNIYPGADVSAAIEKISQTWQTYVDEANAKKN